MLAITLPVGGDQLFGPIFLASGATVETNTLTIQLDDTSNPGFVTATVTADSPSVGPVTQVYWNFSSITFVGSSDADGSIVNDIQLQSPYEVHVVGFGASGAGLPISPTNWQADAIFTASPTVPINQFLDLFNADKLSVKAGVLGGSAAVSTIGGEFLSPTDLSIPGREGAIIELSDATVGITDNLQTAIRTYQLSLQATNGGISLDADVSTIADFTVATIAGSLSLGDATGVITRSFASNEGDIRVSSTAGPITANQAAFTAVLGGVEIATPLGLTVTGANSSFTAPQAYVAPPPAPPDVADGLVRLQGTLAITLPPSLAVTASRLELVTSGAAPIQLTGLAVGSLAATTAGALDIVNSVPLTISDFTNAATVEIVATDVTLRSPAGLRVVDGISVTGNLVLSTYVTGTKVAPVVPVDFVVTGTGDNPLAGDPFAGTLRDMIEYVNANRILPAATTDGVTRQPMQILFDEPGSPVATSGTVTLSATLPSIEKAITFDGSLPSGSSVVIDGNGLAANGIVLGAGASGSVIRNAQFDGFIGAGIRIESADNVITGLTLGTLGGGAGNAIGVDLFGRGAVRNVIGIGTIGVDLGNVIVGNTQAGVLIRGGANYNAIYGNTIGDVVSGNADGVHVVASIGTIIGGPQVELRNFVSNNTGNGIRLTSVNGVSVAYGAQIVNNVIDDNGAAGVLIEGGAKNVLGGTGFNAGNSLSGNAVGVQLQSAGTIRTRGNQIVNNQIVDSGVGGILVDQGFGNLIQGNDVSDGLGASEWGIRLFRTPQARTFGPNQVFQNTVSGAGDSPLNGGIVVENSSGQVIGGPGTLANRVIDNGGSGIVVVGGTGVNAARSNLIEGNLVGTDPAGGNLGNAFDGIRIQGSLGNVVRGNTVRNQDDAANNAAGIAVYDSIALGPAMGNSIVLNTVADNDVGIRVMGGAHVAIGGRVAGLGNWVFDNASDGIFVGRSEATGDAASTVIRGNWVGVATGPLPAGNGGYGINLVTTVGTRIDQGNLVAYNADGGIRMEGGRGAVIGSVMAGLGNLIRDNGGDGIALVQPASPGRTEAVVIAGNTIRENIGNGISVADAVAVSAATSRVSGITIGRGVAVNRPDAASNAIVANGGAGVLVDRAQAVSVIGNAIVGNLGASQIILQHDANAVVLPGPAASVLSPTLSAATPRVVGQSSPQYDVRGSVARTNSGTAPQTVLVDLYGTNTATSEQFFLGRVVVTIGAGASSANFRVIVGKTRARFDQVVATATLGGGTSAFSNAMVV